MNKNSYYSLFALAMLFVASIGLGIFAKISSDSSLNISADSSLSGLPEYSDQCRYREVPLKSGINIFKNNGAAFDLSDKVVVYRENLISLKEGRDAGSIGVVRNVSSGVNLSDADVSVGRGEQFSIMVLDSSSAISLCLEDLI